MTTVLKALARRVLTLVRRRLTISRRRDVLNAAGAVVVAPVVVAGGPDHKEVAGDRVVHGFASFPVTAPTGVRRRHAAEFKKPTRGALR